MGTGTGVPSCQSLAGGQPLSVLDAGPGGKPAFVGAQFQ
jgi:hypothetical protein